mmetsp:Transcript_21287/g.52250  ORF Transcript_21287/g.52250 Transcript_21287/m.52250 type:complete len:219 (-) Transcript_21287:299-955(-)
MAAPSLLCKPSYKDAATVGDCPFTHFVRMSFALAGKAVAPLPTKKEDKPKWLLDDHNGSMPCLAPAGPADGTGAVSDSLQIATAALPAVPADEASMAAAQGFFPSIAKLIKNKEAVGEGDDVALRAGLTEALAKLDAHLVTAATPFFGGVAPGLSDGLIATKLFVIDVAAKHYKSFTLDASATPALAAYQERIFAHPSFAETKYDPDDAITGWGEARG